MQPAYRTIRGLGQDELPLNEGNLRAVSAKKKATCGDMRQVASRFRKAEDMGYASPAFFIPWPVSILQPNALRSSDLRLSVSSRLIRSNPVFGGHQQGQNRDKFWWPVATIVLGLLTASLLLGVVVNEGSADDERREGEPLPRYKRRRRPALEDLGLAPDEVLAEFANCYLSYAIKLWPDLAKEGVIPKPTDEVVFDMVENFKARHRTGQIDETALEILIDHQLIGGAMYPRYSDDSSQTKSIPDQARQMLMKAKEQNRFVPWELVFADYARSATYGTRQGFTSLVSGLKQCGKEVDTVYIDDFQRGSRDEPEWWYLAGTCKNLGLHLYGASDGFSLEGENWEEKLRLYNLFTQMEGKYRRNRVRRGMLGAAHRHRVRGKLSLGLTRTEERDSNGQIVRRPNGIPYYVPCIDPVTRRYCTF